MIGTRIAVGFLLAGSASALLLVADRYLAPWFPILFAALAAIGVLASRELCHLFPAAYRPKTARVAAGVLLVVAANWCHPTALGPAHSPLPAGAMGLVYVLLAFAGVLIGLFLIEMAEYREPGTAIPRLALTVFAVAYLGVLASFLARMRWLHPDPWRTSLYMLLTLLTPKMGDVGAFFTGTFVGRTKMTPILSPKKTWEGFAGGLLTAVLIAVGLSFVPVTGGPVFRGGLAEAAAFGIVIGLAGVFGDLAEALIKRDGQSKDAAMRIAGFGGVLDVVDSILFAAPVAYLWFALLGP